MTTFESQQVEVNKPAEKLFTLMSDFNNFKGLMPEQVTQWESSSEECSFNVQGMATLSLKMIEKIPNSLIKIATTKGPVKFFMHVKLNELAADRTMAQVIFESDLNPMMKMMLEKPLTNFANALATKLRDMP